MEDFLQARLDGRDFLSIGGLMAAGLALRLRYFSGFGLGDDVLFRHAIYTLLNSHIVPPDNGAYRFTWWFPTALSCRILGQNEVAMIVPIVVIDTIGLGVVYALGKALYGRAGGVIAALLLLVYPLDVAWSTMMTSDIFLSVFAALTFLGMLRALDEAEERRARRWWLVAGVSLWLAYHAKISALMLIMPIVVLLWLRRRQLDRAAFVFLWTVVLLFSASALYAYVLMGDPFFPYNSEIGFQGLRGPEAAKWHQLTPYVFWAHPRALFQPNALGNLLHSVYPHLVILFVTLGWIAGLRSSFVVFVWLVVVFLGMQFNIQRADGAWVAGFRNVRHGHVFVYPMVLLLAGYFASLRARVPRLAHGIIAGVLLFSGWQSASTAWKTHIAFNDPRRICHLLAELPMKPVYGDFQIATWASILHLKNQFTPLHSFIPEERRKEIAAVKTGYLVTGGAREPYYGCVDCIPRAAEVSREQWRLVKEFPGPEEFTWWRPEPLRLWETGE